MSEVHEDETANLQSRIARLRKIIPHYIEYNKGRIDISASLLDQILGKVEELTENVRVLSASEFNLAGHLVKVEAINKSLKESIKDTDVESGRAARLSEEMKFEHVPAAWNVGGWLTFDKKFAESRSNEDNLLLEPLYRHPIITGIDENHYDPELEPGLYVAEIMTKGGAACINGRFTEPVTELDAIPAEYQIRVINASGTIWSPWRKVSADYYEKMKPRYEVMNPGVECIQYRELFTASKKS
ncbi:hypothetical protein [Rahnella sikkimica]|nr:hypothetical protein [Rahnella sikkimica]